jgi:thioredoxin-related protein
MRRFFIAACVGLTMAGFAASASAAQLVMLEQAGCAWCKRWNEEIGVVYDRTEEGARAPLRRVDINGPWPKDLASVHRERVTPTFILMDDGVEVGRLRGYPGEHFFWPLLADMLEGLPQSGN